MSITVQGVKHRLVSYYNVNDVVNQQLRTPSQTDNLRSLRLRPELTLKQNFPTPLEEPDEAIEATRIGSHGPYGYLPRRPQNCHPGFICYHPPRSYPQTANQAGIPAAYIAAGPTVGNDFIPAQMDMHRISQGDGEYGALRQSTSMRSSDLLDDTVRTSSHTNNIPPNQTSATLPDVPVQHVSRSHHPAMYPQSSMQLRVWNAPRITGSDDER